jgi:hypothetical protein
VGNLLNLRRDGDRLLQLLIFNEECLVSVSHQLALITSLPFVHTARRSYRLDGPVRFSDWRNVAVSALMRREVTQTLSSRGRRSRNKVSVGEPAEGSLPKIHIPTVFTVLSFVSSSLLSSQGVFRIGGAFNTTHAFYLSAARKSGSGSAFTACPCLYIISLHRDVYK